MTSGLIGSPPRSELPAEAAPRRRQHPLPVAALTGLVSLVVLPLGLGLAARHLGKGDVGLIAGAGLVLIAGGAVLLGHTATVCWRAASLRRRRRWWFVPAAVVALLVMWPIAIGTALSVAPRTSLGAVTPADRGLSYTDVTFRATDGVLLSAWLVPSTNGAAVVLLAGSGSTRAATLPQAVVLARHGYGVLMVDARGQGRSAGRAMDAGWHGDADVVGAVRFLAAQPGVNAGRIALVGLSMGGEEAIGAAPADARIRAVVAEGATGRTAVDKAGWLPHGVNGAVQRVMDRVTDGVVRVLTGARPPTNLHAAVGRATGTAFLLIAAGRMPDEPHAAAYLESAAPSRVQVWTVPEAAHTHGLQTAPAQWESHVVGFLDGALSATS